MFEQTYILHCKLLSERKQYLDSKLKDIGICNPQWITDFDASELTEELINSYYTEDQEVCKRRILPLWDISQHIERRLGIAEISLAIKYVTALNKIANSELEFGLILEDDCLFCEDFSNIFQKYLNDTPPDWDVIHVGNGFGMHPVNYISVHNRTSYKMKHPASRCAEAVLVSKNSAKLMSETIKPFYMAADWELAYQYFLHNLNVYWWEPALITQGSHNGTFTSSLRCDL